MASNDLLVVREDLRVYFYTYDGIAKAVDGVNFSVRTGEALGLVGETGCGKTMTIMAIMGLIDHPGKIVSGEILYKGEDLLKKGEKEMQKIRGKAISMIFQDPMSALDPVFTVGDQMVEAFRVHEKMSRKDALKQSLRMIEEVQIADPERVMRRLPHELSGGMQQRIVIAMALAHRPQLLLADEPTTALDVTIQAQILHLIRKLRVKYNTSMILISHDLGVVQKACDRIGILYAGNLFEVADRDELFSNPLHPYTIGLLHAIPRLDQEKDELSVIRGNLPDIKNIPPGCTFQSRCANAIEKCNQQRPILIERAPGHWVACHQ